MHLRKRVLVTGGSGFLGSHLCERLLQDGCEVICVDNFFTSSKQTIEQILPDPRLEVIRHDITFPLYVEADESFNLTCPASPIHDQFDPAQTIKIYAHRAINILNYSNLLLSDHIVGRQVGEQRKAIMITSNTSQIAKRRLHES